MATSIWTPIVRSLIRNSLAAGWSGNRIYNSLHDWGLPKYHRETFLKVVGYEREFLRVTAPTLKYPRHLKFDQNLMVEEYFPGEFKYRLFGTAQIRDRTTGEIFTKDTSMYSDYWASEDMWEEDFKTGYHDKYQNRNYQILAVTYSKISHHEGYAY